MGIKSTYDIDRQTAIAVIIKKVYGFTNEQLADMLLDFEESHFRNYSVYDELPNEYSRTIKTVDDFDSGI